MLPPVVSMSTPGPAGAERACVADREKEAGPDPAARARQAAALRGDRGPEAFAAAWRDAEAHATPVLHALLRRWAADLSADDRDDVVGETWRLAFEHIRSWSGEGRFDAWLSTIARRAAVDARRRLASRSLPEKDTAIEQFTDDEQRLLQRLDLELLEIELTPVERDILQLVIAGLTMQEIAVHFGFARGNWAVTRVSRIRARLRDLWRERNRNDATGSDHDV